MTYIMCPQSELRTESECRNETKSFAKRRKSIMYKKISSTAKNTYLALG